MSVTPQTNTTLEAMADELLRHESFALCGHVNPDGDCLGSQLALGAALRSLGKHVVQLLASHDPIDAGLRFLPGADAFIPAADFDGAVDAFVACDVPTLERLGDAARVHAAASAHFTIDHHAVPTAMAECNYVDPDAPACGMLVWQLAKALGAEPSPAVATCCYTALMTDTGRFQYQNTSAQAFSAAAEMVAAGADPAVCSREAYQSRTLASLRLECVALENMRIGAQGAWVLSHATLDDFTRLGAVKSDAEQLIDVLRSLHGAHVACMLREQADGVRGSLRAKGDDIDVSALAREIGGGGHKAAAGFTYDGTLSQALCELPAKLDALVAGVAAPEGQDAA